MTRKEIMELGRHIADKIFHEKHKEVKIYGHIESQGTDGKIYIEEDILNKAMAKAKFDHGDIIEITIKKI